MPSSNEVISTRPLQILEEREKMIEFLQSEEFELLLSKSSKRTVEHLLVRMGFRLEGAQGINDLQEDMAFLRRIRKEFPDFEDQMQSFANEMLSLRKDQKHHEIICGDRYENIARRQKRADKDRRTIKRAMISVALSFIALCVTIIGFLIEDKFF